MLLLFGTKWNIHEILSPSHFLNAVRVWSIPSVARWNTCVCTRANRTDQHNVTMQTMFGRISSSRNASRNEGATKIMMKILCKHIQWTSNIDTKPQTWSTSHPEECSCKFSKQSYSREIFKCRKVLLWWHDYGRNETAMRWQWDGNEMAMLQVNNKWKNNIFIIYLGWKRKGVSETKCTLNRSTANK